MQYTIDYDLVMEALELLLDAQTEIAHGRQLDGDELGCRRAQKLVERTERELLRLRWMAGG